MFINIFEIFQHLKQFLRCAFVDFGAPRESILNKQDLLEDDLRMKV